MWAHISDVNNHCARKSLNWHTPLEVFSGETPDLSIFRHAFYGPVWYREWCTKAGEVKMFKGRHLGIAWNVGDSLCSKIMEVNENPKKYCQFLHRSVILPRDPNMAFEHQMLLYLKHKYFLTVIADETLSNIQGAEKLDATPVVLPLGDKHMGKRMKVNAEGAQAPDATSFQMPMEVGKPKENRDDPNLESESESEPLEEEPVV